MKWMEIDQNYLQTGIAIGSRVSHEHQLRCLVHKLHDSLTALR